VILRAAKFFFRTVILSKREIPDGEIMTLQLFPQLCRVNVIIPASE